MAIAKTGKQVASTATYTIVNRKMRHEPLQSAQTGMSGKAINAIVLLHAYSIQLQTHTHTRAH